MKHPVFNTSLLYSWGSALVPFVAIASMLVKFSFLLFHDFRMVLCEPTSSHTIATRHTCAIVLCCVLMFPAANCAFTCNTIPDRSSFSSNFQGYVHASLSICLLYLCKRLSHAKNISLSVIFNLESCSRVSGELEQSHMAIQAPTARHVILDGLKELSRNIHRRRDTKYTIQQCNVIPNFRQDPAVEAPFFCRINVTSLTRRRPRHQLHTSKAVSDLLHVLSKPLVSLIHTSLKPPSLQRKSITRFRCRFPLQCVMTQISLSSRRDSDTIT